MVAIMDKNDPDLSNASNQDIVEAEQGRQDCRGSTGSDDSDIIRVIGESEKSDEEGMKASIEGVLEGYNQLHIKYGDLPHPDLCLQMFGDDFKRREDASSAWLREKDLVFSRDERCSFTFDTVALAERGDLQSVQWQMGKIEVFARDLRKNGGFFFFREYSPDKLSNKIYDGTHVFWCPDRMKEALPMLSVERMNFCEEFSDAGERGGRDDRLLSDILEKRKEATELWKTGGPRITYHYKGEPGRRERQTGSRYVTDYGNGCVSPRKNLCQNFQDPHLTGPWQRLW